MAATGRFHGAARDCLPVETLSDESYSGGVKTPTKKLEDQPHFHVVSADMQTVYYDGNIDFEIRGSFDRVDGVHEGHSWLLLPGRESLVGDLRFIDRGAKSAMFVTAEREIPNLKDLRVPYLAGRRKPYHIWMTTEPGWVWNRILFNGCWSCERCDICRETIEAGQYGFVDRSGHRICEKCYGQYVVTHDLSFVDRY